MPYPWQTQDCCDGCAIAFLEGEEPEIVDGKKVHSRCIALYVERKRRRPIGDEDGLPIIPGKV